MTSTITDPSLLQCSRVDVMDVRPVLESGKEPFDSIQYSLSSLADDSTLLIVAPFEPRPLKKYVQREGFTFVHDSISRRMHWLAVYSGNTDHEVEVSGPGPSYALPVGNSDHVVYLDCRELDHSAIVDWINSTLSGLAPDDLLVVHSSSWEEGLHESLRGGELSRKSINSSHVRVEIDAGNSPD